MKTFKVGSTAASKGQKMGGDHSPEDTLHAFYFSRALMYTTIRIRASVLQ